MAVEAVKGSTTARQSTVKNLRLTACSILPVSRLAATSLLAHDMLLTTITTCVVSALSSANVWKSK